MKVLLTGLVFVFVGSLYAMGASKESKFDMRIVGSSFLGGTLMILCGGLYWIWVE